jgi:hypothetical protein
MDKFQNVVWFWIIHVHICYDAEVHFYMIPMQFVVCKSDHFWASYNILKFLKLCVETACGRKFVRLPDPTVQWGWKKIRTLQVLVLFEVSVSFSFFFFLWPQERQSLTALKGKESYKYNPARGRGGRSRSKPEKAVNIFFQPHCTVVVSVTHVWCKSILIRHVKITRQWYFPNGFGMNLDFGASLQILNLMVPFRVWPRRFISRHFSALCWRNPSHCTRLSVHIIMQF